MKICIHLPGTINHGLDSPERAESRWAQNLARMLASFGHDVFTDITAAGSWGSSKPVNKVYLQQKAPRDILYDVYLDPCWYYGKRIKYKSKLYVHMHMGWDGNLNRDEHMPKRHVAAYPFKHFKGGFLGPNSKVSNRSFLLPVPLYEKEMKSPNFEAKGLTFSMKDAFIKPEIARENIKVISAMNILSKKYSLPCYGFMRDQIIKHPDAINIMKKNKNFKLFTKMPLFKVQEILKKTKILLPGPGRGSSTIEAVAEGVLPINWDGVITLGKAAKELGFLIDNKKPTVSFFVDHIEQFILNEDLYKNTVIRYQKEFVDNSYENSHNMFIAMCKKKMVI